MVNVVAVRSWSLMDALGRVPLHSRSYNVKRLKLIKFSCWPELSWFFLGLRLVGGSWKGEGRVEIFNNGNWGTVCDDDWDKNDARVVCRQLGFPNVDSAPGSARFGSGSGQIWLDDVGCSGSESSIINCQHRGWGVENCGHSEDASVICSST